MPLSRKIRRRFYLTIPAAGAQVGWRRSESYRAAGRGDIPTERDGRLRLVPRKRWDPIKKRVLRGLPPKPRREAATAAESATTGS
jgi:hypothetical protein